jgi:hypothetical protein
VHILLFKKEYIHLYLSHSLKLAKVTCIDFFYTMSWLWQLLSPRLSRPTLKYQLPCWKYASDDFANHPESSIYTNIGAKRLSFVKRTCSRHPTYVNKQWQTAFPISDWLADVNRVARNIKFGVTHLERGDIFRKSGFRSNFAIPIRISGFIFSTISNRENPI